MRYRDEARKSTCANCSWFRPAARLGRRAVRFFDNTAQNKTHCECGSLTRSRPREPGIGSASRSAIEFQINTMPTSTVIMSTLSRPDVTANIASLQIVRAQPEEAPTLTHIAFRAKRHWGYPEPWIESWREILTIRPEYVARHDTYAARIGDRTVGFYSLSSEGGVSRLEHLWVLPEAMRQGVGRALFAHAVVRAGGMGCRKLEIESDPNAEGFYQRMGARRAGVNFTEVEGQRRELPVFVYEIDRTGSTFRTL